MAKQVRGKYFRSSVWAALLAGTLLPTPGGALEEWPTYGHDYGDTRYSPLAQITPANVASLKRRGRGAASLRRKTRHW
jgi:hypothetical protein